MRENTDVVRPTRALAWTVVANGVEEAVFGPFVLRITAFDFGVYVGGQDAPIAYRRIDDAYEATRAPTRAMCEALLAARLIAAAKTMSGSLLEPDPAFARSRRSRGKHG